MSGRWDIRKAVLRGQGHREPQENFGGERSTSTKGGKQGSGERGGLESMIDEMLVPLMRETGRDDGEKTEGRERMWRERERRLPKLALPESDL